MKTLAIILWAGVMLAVIAMLVGAVIEIESILVTGPLLALSGLVLAALSTRLHAATPFVFAISGPVVAALIALMIALGGLGPDESEKPVFVIMSAYLFLVLPVAMFALREIFRWDAAPADLAPPWQFSLKTLLIIMTFLCLTAASGKLLTEVIHPGEPLIFGGFAMLVLALCAVVMWRLIATRKQAASPKTNAEGNL